MRWSPWYRGYRVVGYSWCCARIMGKDQTPCGHLMITTVLFIPSLIWSWDDRVMSEVGKWCMWWLRGNPSRTNGACSVIMLRASIIKFICSCHAHIVLAVSCSCCSCYVLRMYHDNPCLTCNYHVVVCLECFWLLWACKYIQCTDLACHASLQVIPDLIACLTWSPCLRARISVPARVPVEWSSPPSSLFRCQ